MRIPAISAGLVAVLVTVGAAAPAKQETTERVRYSDVKPTTKKPENKTDARDPAAGDGWVEIADPTPARFGKVFITLGKSAGTFTRLRLDAARGRAYIEKVRIDFADGSHRVARVDAVLRRKHPAYVDLRGAHAIDQVVVYADKDTGGTYTVHAQPSDAAAVASR